MPAGEWKGQSCLVCHRYLSACTCKPSALDVVDAASYRAGLEAAARMVEDFRRYRGQPKDALVDKSFDDDEVRCPHCDKKHDLKKSRYWCREVYSGLTDLSAAIVALPTPSTLPQEGNNHGG